MSFSDIFDRLGDNEEFLYRMSFRKMKESLPKEERKNIITEDQYIKELQRDGII